VLCNYINLEEKVKHGSAFFPFVIYPSCYSSCGAGFPVHWHKEMEIGLVRSGEEVFQINQKEYVTRKGDIVLIPPETLHGLEPRTKNKVQRDTLVFDLNLLISNTSDASSLKYIMPLLQGKCSCDYVFQDENAEALLMEIRQIFSQKKEGYELLVKGKLLFLFYRLFELGVIRTDERLEKVPIVYESMLDAMKYIASHYQGKITLDEIAKQTGKSKYYITRNFHKFTGMPCIEYINHYRLTMAANILMETNRLVIDIAMDVGFENISYFNKLFRKKFGVTPKEYRKEMLRI
jgi:AraC-like DNA-binding protein